MKTSIFFTLLTVLFTTAAFAEDSMLCRPQAQAIAVNEITDELDINPDVCSAVINSTISDVGGIIAYQTDVICGDESVASNHHADQVVVYTKDCTDASPDQH